MPRAHRAPADELDVACWRAPLTVIDLLLLQGLLNLDAKLNEALLQKR